MNLEAIEQRTLQFLLHSSNPLVSVDTLLRHLERHEDCLGVDLHTLLPFLRKHELFRVMETPGLDAEGEVTRALADAGFPVGPQVVLDTRIPDRFELARLMNAQMQTLLEAINAAMNAARDQGQAQRVRALMALRERAGHIAEKMEPLL